MQLDADPEAIDTDLAENRIAEGIRERLREAVEAAGGATAVSRRSGVPFGSLTKYLAGRQMRPSTLVLLAEATNRTVGWLATGEGPMRPADSQPAIAPSREQPAPEAPPAPPPAAQRLFGQVKIDQLVSAYEAALAASGQTTDRRLLMHLTVVMYDALTDAAEARKAEENRASPQSSPQTAPQD